MAEPLAAIWRMHFEYIVDGLTHELNHYCEATSTTTSAQLIQRDGSTLMAPSVAADTIGFQMAELYPAANPGTLAWQLQYRDGTNWLPQITGEATVSGDNTAPVKYASQNTLVLRDTAFKKLHVVLLESPIVPSYHFNTVGSSSGALHTFSSRLWAAMLQYTPDSEELTRPYDWVKSRGDRYLNENPVVGITGDLNDKVRRARGLT